MSVRRLACVLFAASALGCGRSTALAPSGAAGTSGGGSTGAAGGAGVGGAAGAPLPINAGCGKPLPDNQVPTVLGKPTGYTQFKVMETGATLAGPRPERAGPRTFWVRVPVDYDPNHKYRVVYLGQGCGGYEIANTSTMQLFAGYRGGEEEAIYVALDIPTNMINQDCFDTAVGPASQEWEAFELFHTFVDANFCVDNDNVFVSGYGSGGTLSNMWGCYFAGDGDHPWNGVPGGSPPGTAVAPRRFAPRYHIHGQAPVSGGVPDNMPPCNGPVASIWIHDTADVDPYSSVRDIALPRVLKLNGCYSPTPNTAPWHEEIAGKGVCVQYTDCPAPYPVVLCTTVGQGSHSDHHEIAIPAFKLFFDEAAAP